MIRAWWSWLLLLGVVAQPVVAAAESGPLRLGVAAGENHQRVSLSLENVSEATALVYVDRRLAQVELRSESRSLGVCRLPSESVPRRPDDRRFVQLEPGARASEPLDLRFVCFGRLLGRLAEASVIRVTYQVRFGTDRMGRTAWTGRLGPVETTLTPATVTAAPRAGPADPLQLVRIGAQPDVQSGESISVAFELRGPPRGRLPVAIRPELFSFQVVTPTGRLEVCRLPTSRVRPLREFYSRLGRQRLGFEIAGTCPANLFADQGVYEIQPTFVAAFDGRDVGLTAWTGRVEGETFLARVRRAGRNASDPVEIILPGSVVEGDGDAR